MTQFRGAHIVAVVALLAAVVQYRGGATGSVVANPEWEAKVSALEAKEGPVLTITDKKGKPHVAEVTQANGIATLSVQHGSTEAHWVGCIYAKDQDGVVIHYEDKPREAAPKPIVSQFKIPDGVTSLVAYEWCNLDGIYKSDIVAVDPAVAAVGAVASTEGA
jgi:desulfoferrodoxin (superoxide reductase-like protein)